MSIKIITDSASDITQAEARDWNIQVLPLRTLFGEEEFLDGVTIQHEEFFHRLIESDVLPTTSQLSPYEYGAAFRDAVEAGDTVICITLSSHLSGSYQSAAIAAEEFPGQVLLVDSENVCLGQRILVQMAIRLVAEGRSPQDVQAALNEEKKKIRLIALLDTLEYLKKGGRISSTAALAGTLLSIKPVVAIEGGKIALLGKARGSKNGHNMLRTLVNDCGGIHFGKPFCLGYSGLSDAMLQKYIADSAVLYQGKTDHLPICSIGSSIGTHVGPGAIAAAFFIQE